MNIEAGLKRVKELLESRNVVPSKDVLLASMPAALAIANEGLEAYTNNNISGAAYALGFAQRACIGFGVYSKEDLQSVTKAMETPRKKKE